MGLSAPEPGSPRLARRPQTLDKLPALPRTLPERHPPARPFGAHLKGSSAKTRGHQELGLFAVPQKGQDGDRGQSAGAAARGSSGGVVRLSRLLRNEPSKASIRPVLLFYFFSAHPHPLRVLKGKDGRRGACWEL